MGNNDDFYLIMPGDVLIRLYHFTYEDFQFIF